MRLLVDTHAFIWFVNGDEQMSEPARRAIENEENERWLSIVSPWEMAIKLSIGKLTLDRRLERFVSEQVDANDFQILGVNLSHVWTVAALPLHHRDPFDRLLIAQGMVENMPIVSSDASFDSYGVSRIW